MNYGYFDNKNREYVITNPQTPTPWINYIGNGGFGGIVSATGGGLTFDSDPSNRRVPVINSIISQWTGRADIFISAMKRAEIIGQPPGSR